PFAEALLLQPGSCAVDELADLAVGGHLSEEVGARPLPVRSCGLVEERVDGARCQLLVPGYAGGIAGNPGVRGSRSRTAGPVRSTRWHSFPSLFDLETVCSPFQTPRLCRCQALGRRGSGPQRFQRAIEHNFAASRQSCIPVPLVTAKFIKN